MPTTYFRILCLCIALAGAETLHGIARTVVLARWLGPSRAKRWSIISGTLIAFAICWLLVPWLDLHHPLPLILTGLILAAFMAAFDIILAHWVIGMTWPKVLADFNPRHGNLLAIGLLLLVVMPSLVMAVSSP